FAMVYIVWGSTFFFIHKALAGFGPFLLGAIRFTIAGTLLFGWCYYKGYRLFDRSTMMRASFTGLLLLYVDNGIIIWVIQFLSCALVASMYASAAIWIIILDKANLNSYYNNLVIFDGLFNGAYIVVILFDIEVANPMIADQK